MSKIYINMLIFLLKGLVEGVSKLEINNKRSEVVDCCTVIIEYLENKKVNK